MVSSMFDMYITQNRMSPHNSNNTYFRQGYVYFHLETLLGSFTLFKQLMHTFVSITCQNIYFQKQPETILKHSLWSTALQSWELKMPIIDVFTIASDLSLD